MATHHAQHEQPVMQYMLCMADCSDAVECLEAAVRLGHLEVARELLLQGVRLPSPLHKQDFEADTSSEIERDLNEPSTWRSSWRLLPDRFPICPLGLAQRAVWRQFTPRDESDSESDSFSEDPEEWRDSSGNLWRNEGSEEGICFFGRWCQGSWCQWAMDWDQPIRKCRARVAIPTTRLILALAARGELTTIEIAPDGAARLLDAAILLGEADAAKEVLAQFPRTSRTLRFWSFDDFIDSRRSGNEFIHRFKHPDVVMAAVVAGAEVSSIHHRNHPDGMYLFELAVASGHGQMAQLMMKKSPRPLRLSNWLAREYVECDDYTGQCRLGDAQVATLLAVGAELSCLHFRCISSCTVPGCRAERDIFCVSLLGFAILTGDVQHVEVLMAELQQHYPLAFQPPDHMPLSHHRPEALDVFGASLFGLCHLCGGTAQCSTHDGRKSRDSGWSFASPDQRRIAAAAALRRAFHLSYCRAAAIYGMALVQLVKRFAELGTTITDVVLNIIAFASDVPEMSKMPGFVEFDIWGIVAAWEYDGWRSQFTLHRLIV